MPREGRNYDVQRRLRGSLRRPLTGNELGRPPDSAKAVRGVDDDDDADADLVTFP